MRHEELRRFVNQLLQLRPAALERFEEIAATGELQAVYYDLSNGVTPALFVVVARASRDKCLQLPFEGGEGGDRVE